MADRLSQEAVEVLYRPAGTARVSQDAVEVLVARDVLQAGVSQLAVEALVQVPRELALPFIASQTQVFPPFSIFSDPTGTGAGTGGEGFRILLAAAGASYTATLSSAMSPTTGTFTLTDDSDLPATGSFVLELDGEAMLVTKIGAGLYKALIRGLSGTVAIAHTVGATGTWGDSYDMAIESLVDISMDIEYAATSYPGWLIAFDSTQAYLAGARYPMHVTELVGVFPAGDVGGASRIDGAQPSAVHVPPGVSEDCPAAMTVPARIATGIQVSDVAIVRYTNPAASVLELGSRSCAIQSWYGLKRVDDLNNDVTFTDPDGNIVDGTAEDSFTGASFVTTTLLGDDRVFTYGPPRFSNKGWPIAALAVRHGQRRIPYWESPTWRDFDFVYSGFFTDATYVQILVNRNGLIFGPDPEVSLPGPQDIDGPDATWDDSSYRTSTAWYVAIFMGSYVFIGPIFNLPPGEGVPPPDLIPIVLPPVGGEPGVIVEPSIVFEGGSGGGIYPPRADPDDGGEFRVMLV